MPSTVGRDRWIFEFKGSLVYRVSFRTARATQKNSASNRKKKKEKKGEKMALMVGSVPAGR